MRILLVNDHGRAYGGAEMQMLALRESLERRGHQTRFLSSTAEMIPGFPLLADRHCHGRSDLAQVALQTFNPTVWRPLRRELREYPPDIVHVRSFLWQLSPLILPLLTRVPVFHLAPTYKEICPNGLKLIPDGSACTVNAGPVCRTSGCVSARTYAAARIQMHMLRRWRHAIDVTAVLSRCAAEAFRRAGWQDVEVLPNAADPRASTARPSDVPTLAYAGRLSREKGVHLLIEAFAHASRTVPGARLLIAGTGPDAEQLRAAAVRHEANVEFLGHLEPDAMDRALSSAWAQAVPSLWHEPFGNVTLEAMMRGTAVVGSDAGAIPDVVLHGQTGLVLQPGDVEAWRKGIVDLLSNPELCRRMGAAGRRRAEEEFGRERHTDRVLALYEKARSRFAARGAAADGQPGTEGLHR